MGDEKAEQYKGRAKEAAGDVSDRDDLKREGKADQASGKVKEKVDEVTDKAKETFSDDDR